MEIDVAALRETETAGAAGDPGGHEMWVPSAPQLAIAVDWPRVDEVRVEVFSDDGARAQRPQSNWSAAGIKVGPGTEKHSPPSAPITCVRGVGWLWSMWSPHGGQTCTDLCGVRWSTNNMHRGLPIHEYADEGNIGGVRDELAKGTAVDAVDADSHRTPLMSALASARPNLDLVRLMIRSGANVNAFCGFEMDALARRNASGH